ncbi:MAG: hypothetical protein IT516_09150 [Burkholderiales bacterium]|nr:hypothetical protein [Burkholderiales bacterium]
MIEAIEVALATLRQANPGVGRVSPAAGEHRLRKVLVANRGEIAKRFFFALREEGIPSVAVVTDPDRKQSWHEFADEVVRIGDPAGYTDIPRILAAALLSGANGVYPGYGFLSENFRLVEAIDALRMSGRHDIHFMGPPADVMRRVGDKLDARVLAKAHGVPLLEGSPALSDLAAAQTEATRIGYPVIVKLSAGGGGKGMAVARNATELQAACESARRIGKANYDDDTLFVERYVERPVHFEVQIFNGMAVGIRKCAVQRKNQKIIEESGDAFLDHGTTLKLLAAAENVASFSGYAKGGGAGTVEFLFDAERAEFGFLEMNTRLQVEYPVTDQSLHIDLAKWQILFFDGREKEIPYDRALRLRFAEKDHAVECRIYAEDPLNDYAPSPGIIRDLDLPTFNGVRCDVGFKAGDAVLTDYDAMIAKIIAFGRTRRESLMRLERALGEIYIRGITTNVELLLEVLRHRSFRGGEYTNRLLDERPSWRVVRANDQLITVAVFAALAELVRQAHQALGMALRQGDLESILRRGALALLPKFHVEVHERRFLVAFLQCELRTYAAFVNQVHVGDVYVDQRIPGSGDYVFQFAGRSYPVRIDRRPAHHSIRIMEHDGIQYYRVHVHPMGSSRAVDPPGAVRCPFQGAFVKWSEQGDGRAVRVGARVARGDPLIVIEAMKMESTLTSPIAGRVSYLVEDGDPTRLVRGTTAQGLVLGKALAEGELLVVVDADEAETRPSFEWDPTPIAAAADPLLAKLADPELPDGGLATAIVTSSGDALVRALGLVRGFYLGYVQTEELPDQLVRCLETLGLSGVDVGHADVAIAEVLETFVALKQIYSSAMGANQTWFGEMNRLVLEWDDETYSPPAVFRSVMNSLRQKYGIPRVDGKRSPEMQMALLYLFRGYGAIHEGRAVLVGLLELLVARAFVPRHSRAALARLTGIEESEPDDTIAVLGRRLLARPSFPSRRSGDDEGKEGATERGRRQARHTRRRGIQDDAFRERARSALTRGGAIVSYASAPRWVRDELDSHLAAWSRRYRVESLPSPQPTIFQFRLVSERAGDAPRYATLVWLEEGAPITEADVTGRIRSAPNVERAAIQASRVLTTYHALDPGEGNLVEILACGNPVTIDLASGGADVIDYEALRAIATRPARLFLHTPADHVLVRVQVRRPNSTKTRRQVFSAALQRGRIRLDLMQEDDARNPVATSMATGPDQRLFDLGKWPLERWVEECFDADSAREITIESIDVEPHDPSTSRAPAVLAAARRRVVGARIFEGVIAGHPAVFFCKDSRVSGGATGDLEGRKYVAACYYAYLRDVPLYVWNDGAGANVREGMVALNRAAQGFLMNALVGHSHDHARFREVVRALDDPVVTSLFDEIDRSFDFPSLQHGHGRPRNFVSIAVGVGSATGLDVYGSSQACIQIMLDAEQSYRALTGAGVIRAVTGESLTNYEIGGARVMGAWTGTVDLVARDRIELLRHIRKIQLLCSRSCHRPSIARALVHAEATGDRFAATIFNESDVAANVDAGSFVAFKDEYVEAAALVGGFARLGGKPVLIMGPRSDTGVRSLASLVRTKELLRTATKMRVPRILVFGNRWYRAVEGEGDAAISVQSDVIKELTRSTSPRIHIVTRIGGLRLVTLNSQADVTIHVHASAESDKGSTLAAQVATFRVETLREAFDLANTLLGYFGLRNGHVPAGPPQATPRIPADVTQPFDMVGDVIEGVFDAGSFLEFHRTSDDAAGSTLVTGLATLDGKVTAVIADQPRHGGGPDAPGTEKFRLFMEFVERNRFPLVMLSNAPGFVPGTKQERLRIQQIGGESLDVNALSTVPVVSVVLNHNYGGRQIHAFSRFLRPGVVYITLERTILAVMGGPAAFDLFHGRRYRELEGQGKADEAQAMRDAYLEEFNRKALAGADAASTGAIDWTVGRADDLRNHIKRALEIAESRAGWRVDATQ